MLSEFTLFLCLLHVMSAGQRTVNRGLHLRKTPQHMQTLRHDRYKYLHAHHRKWVTEAGRCVCHSEVMWHLRMILCDSWGCHVTLLFLSADPVWLQWFVPLISSDRSVWDSDAALMFSAFPASGSPDALMSCFGSEKVVSYSLIHCVINCAPAVNVHFFSCSTFIWC